MNIDPFGLEDLGEALIETQGTYTTAEVQVINIWENENGMKIVDRLKIEIQVPTKVYTQPDDEPMLFFGCPLPSKSTSESLTDRIMRNIKHLGPQINKSKPSDERSGGGIRG